MTAPSRPLWADQKEGRFYTRIPVTNMLNGGTLELPLHVVTGRHAGPTLGIITNVHGDEFLPTTAIRELIATLDTGTLKGRLAIISVANPLADYRVELRRVGQPPRVVVEPGLRHHIFAPDETQQPLGYRLRAGR